MLDLSSVTNLLPKRMRDSVDVYFENLSALTEIRDPKVLAALGPSAVRGLLLKRGKQGAPTRVVSGHAVYFDWSYPADHPEMAELYRRAKQGQWDSDVVLPWETSVDPLNPEVPLLPATFFDVERLESYAGVKLDANERMRLNHSIIAWLISQSLHGEQGALFAAAQVTEAVQFFDGKFYGASQVMDEARHVEVFSRYLDGKLNRLYQINDNLFVIVDALMSDSRWDMKFIGMQIMIEGLALGAFGMMYRLTKEPLLRKLLSYVIQDESRHVHYGVLALREHIRNELSEAERREREDWCFEVSLLMRNRFMAYEVYDEWFSGLITRAQWRDVVISSQGMNQFRSTMFSRLMPNLREIGLLSPRIMPHYERVGLRQYFDGRAADSITGDQMLAELDAPMAA